MRHDGHKAYDINKAGVPRVGLDSVDEAAGAVSLCKVRTLNQGTASVGTRHPNRERVCAFKNVPLGSKRRRMLTKSS
jgi:hypothetical protein